MDGLAFGWRTALLTLAVAQLLLIAAALTRPLANRAAHRTLAALLVVLAGILPPASDQRRASTAPFQARYGVSPSAYRRASKPEYARA